MLKYKEDVPVYWSSKLAQQSACFLALDCQFLSAYTNGSHPDSLAKGVLIVLLTDTKCLSTRFAHRFLLKICTNTLHCQSQIKINRCYSMLNVISYKKNQYFLCNIMLFWFTILEKCWWLIVITKPNELIIMWPKLPCLKQYEDLILKQIRFVTLS